MKAADLHDIRVLSETLQAACAGHGPMVTLAAIALLRMNEVEKLDTLVKKAKL